MLSEISKSEYELVRPFFKDLAYQLTTSAVLDGLGPGRVFVDDVKSPSAAFMYTVEGFFLAGSPESKIFRDGLKEHVETIITTGNSMRPGEGDLFFGISPETWLEHFHSIFNIRPPLDCPRRHYICTKIEIDWHSMIPEGYKVSRVDSGLITNSKISIPDHMMNWMNLNWGSIDKFVKEGFGFCTLHENKIVSWSICDCISNNQCEIGIHTTPEYRRRGLATITAAAAVDFGLSKGYSQIGWHTDEHNYGSIGVAEKVGFVMERKYIQYACIFDEAVHIAEIGMRKFLDKYYEEAIELFNKAAQIGIIPGWAYYLEARSHVLLSNYGKAIDCMKLSASNGYANIEHVLNCDDLKCLHDNREWTDIINQIKENSLKTHSN